MKQWSSDSFGETKSTKLRTFLNKVQEQPRGFFLVTLQFIVTMSMTIVSAACIGASETSFEEIDEFMLAGLVALAAPVYCAALLSGAAVFLTLCNLYKQTDSNGLGDMLRPSSPQGEYNPLVEAKPPSHWLPDVERRGLGDAIEGINHIALIVEDVGRSLSFYTDVMGFQQIRRPNFDRHGAWLTVGNTELHLIKGRPAVHDGEDLIVSHIALDTKNPFGVLEKLIEWNIPFRQNVSVPDPIKARNNQKEDFSSAEGKVTQFFVRDPDGYYLEICNCDILTKFCLMKEEDMREAMKKFGSVYYREGLPVPEGFSLSMYLLVKSIGVFRRAKRRVRAQLRKGYERMLEEEIERFNIKRAATVDMGKLQKLFNRRKTYTDITQGFSEDEIREALLTAGNNVRVAVLILKVLRGEDTIAVPPSYLCAIDDKGGKEANSSLQPRPFKIPIARTDSKGSLEGLVRKCKPFYDRGPAVTAKVLKDRETAEWTVEAFRNKIVTHASACENLVGNKSAPKSESPTTVGEDTSDSAGCSDRISVHSMKSNESNLSALVRELQMQQAQAVPGAVAFDSVMPAP